MLEERHRESVRRIREQIARAQHDPSRVREALAAVPSAARDEWVDAVLGVQGVPDDGPDLPRGCVPYFPCGVDPLVRVVEQAEVGPGDVFVDLGAGLGRAALLVHFLSGAEVVGVEIQPELARASRELASRLGAERVTFLEGDAAELTGQLPGSVFFLYCPFGGARLDRVLDGLEAVSQRRPIRVACVDLPLPPLPWLLPDAPSAPDVAIYRSDLARGSPAK